MMAGIAACIGFGPTAFFLVTTAAVSIIGLALAIDPGARVDVSALRDGLGSLLEVCMTVVSWALRFVVLMEIVAAICSPGTPGAGIVILAMGIVLLLGVDRLLDMCRVGRMDSKTVRSRGGCREAFENGRHTQHGEL